MKEYLVVYIGGPGNGDREKTIFADEFYVRDDVLAFVVHGGDNLGSRKSRNVALFRGWSYAVEMREEKGE